MTIIATARRTTAFIALTVSILVSGAAALAQTIDTRLTAYIPPSSSESESSAQAHIALPREIVSYAGKHAPGTIVVNTAERRLYLVMEGGKALRYGVGVDRPGFAWTGIHSISMKQKWPDWHPPAAMLKRRPDLPRFMPGGEANPLGARAMYLGTSIYRIHGSNEPTSIGHAVSSGCIRMLNDDVEDLYSRVKVGTRVVVL